MLINNSDKPRDQTRSTIQKEGNLDGEALRVEGGGAAVAAQELPTVSADAAGVVACVLGLP